MNVGQTLSAWSRSADSVLAELHVDPAREDPIDRRIDERPQRGDRVVVAAGTKLRP